MRAWVVYDVWRVLCVCVCVVWCAWLARTEKAKHWFTLTTRGRTFELCADPMTSAMPAGWWVRALMVTIQGWCVPTCRQA